MTGEVLLGSIREDAGMDHGTPPPLHHVAREGVRLIPALAGARVIRAFVGICPMPADGMPIVGSVKMMGHLYVAVAPSAVTLCPLIGEAMADVIVHDHLPKGLEGWGPDRLWSPVPSRAGAAETRQDSLDAP
jgi:glycine/D-amino acid oxidase-like deaminating enzyme